MRQHPHSVSFEFMQQLTLPLVGRELIAAGLALGVVGAAYLCFGILRTPVALGSDVLGPYDADRMHPTGEKHVYTLGVYEVARASISGRYGFGCLALSGLLQLAGALAPSSTRIVTPLLVAIVTAAVATKMGRRYIRLRVTGFNTAVWGSPALTATASLRALRENALSAKKTWREGKFIRFAQRTFMP